MSNFILENWAELTLAILGFVKVIVNLTPTTSDNKVFGYIDTLINLIIADRIKPTKKD
jgi:hypothetical protein